ncbi:MAG: hypothetical protein E6640_08010 [Actinomyces urogenitalis]|uniref:TolB family protein n=1 Tax=Actinomyces urogenitalis TaxID=103621 RepID=UPI00290A6EFC|nr:hypothetical protein [Actinomyces urogenitalis]MDU6152154.1 hypothetical protein [Actinomyces urogenitalis]
MISLTCHHGLETGRGAGRDALQPGQVALLVIHDLRTGSQQVVLESKELIEAPNCWTRDGARLVVNGGGRLLSIAADGSGALTPIEVGAVRGVNNDHVISPDGTTIYFSAEGHLDAVGIEGGQARRISNTHPEDQPYTSWLHGVSPDGQQVAYVSAEPWGEDVFGARNLATIPAAGGAQTQLTTGPNAYDGPEYHPDGGWLYYNSEEASQVAGHAQLFRMRLDTGEREQLTDDDRVNWFPQPQS